MNDLSKNNELLIESNNTKNLLFSIIAHDLRSPFNGIIGLSNELGNHIEEYSKQEIKTFANSIHDLSQQTFFLLENLLEWSKSQSEFFECNPSKFKIDDVITDILSIIKKHTDSKNIEITTQIETNLEVNLDKNIIKPILLNLLTNAVKYTNHNGKIRIRIYTESSNLIITISDTGIGMTENILNSIFEITGKNSSPGTNNEKGSGIGLVLCKILTEKHNGNISVSSQINNGSSFTLTFPQ